MDKDELVYIKVYDEKKWDVVFEGKVCRDVEPCELVQLGCFCERELSGGIYDKRTGEEVKSLTGLQNYVELVATSGVLHWYSGVIYTDADDGVLRKRNYVPRGVKYTSMSLWAMSIEECEKVFRCETLKTLEINECEMRKLPMEITCLQRLTKLRLHDITLITHLPEEMGELVNLEVLVIQYCDVAYLPIKLRKLYALHTLHLTSLPMLELHESNLEVFERLKHITIHSCWEVFTPSFASPFWKMLSFSSSLRSLDLDWNFLSREMIADAIVKNGSITSGGCNYGMPYTEYFERNKENHANTTTCVVRILALKRWRMTSLSYFPKEIVRMMSVMLWNTRCDVEAWTRNYGNKT